MNTSRSQSVLHNLVNERVIENGFPFIVLGKGTFSFVNNHQIGEMENHNKFRNPLQKTSTEVTCVRKRFLFVFVLNKFIHLKISEILSFGRHNLLPVHHKTVGSGGFLHNNTVSNPETLIRVKRVERLI